MGESYNKYDIDLKIDIDNKFISTTSILSYSCKLENLNEVRLYIHKNLDIESITCNRNITYEVGEIISNWSPFILESKLIKISLNEDIPKNENIDFTFKYSGYLDIISTYGVNRLTKDWIELGLYTPWFPLTHNLEQALFNINIDIDDTYKVIGSKQEYDELIIEQKVPNFDCTILASNSFKSVKNTVGKIPIEIYYTDDKYQTMAYDISDITEKVIQKYIEFGNVEIEKYSIVIAPRKYGGGYCRLGLIVVTPQDEFDDKVDYFKFIAHELAHIWWNKSDTNSWQDWLNESFAEYSALIALRDNFKIEDFNKIINIYQEESKGLPPIKNLSRTYENAYKVLYMKGALVLNRLENRIGEEKFKELLHKIHINKVDTTERFLNEIENICNKEIREFIYRLLN